MILDGKAVAVQIVEKLKAELAKKNVTPQLAVILIGDDPASRVYVRNKQKKAEYIGIKTQLFEYPVDVAEKVVLDKIYQLNNDKNVTAILVQMPIPEHISREKIIMAIDPRKDVDCFTPENVGKLSIGLKPYFYPATPQGILMLLDYYKIPIEGKHAVVIGRSNIVGKPMSQMLLKRNATVTICHSHTENLEEIIKTADIIISAVGKKIVRCKMVSKKSVIVDVGIYKDSNGNLTGDVDFAEVAPLVDFISPVPGGVGPMTIASLMINVVNSYDDNNPVS